MNDGRRTVQSPVVELPAGPAHRPDRDVRAIDRGARRILSGDRAALLSLGLVAIVFAVDLCLPLGVASAVPYTFAVLLAVNARSRRFAPAVALLCCALTVAKVVVHSERGTTEPWKVVANRGLALFAIDLTAYLGLKRRRSEERRRVAEERIQLHLADLAHLGRLETAGQLAAGLAHELNQPLAAISLQAEVAVRLALDGERREGDALRTALGEITEQAQRAAAIVRTVRDLVRKAGPRRSTVVVNDVVGAAARLIDAQVRRAGVDLRLRLANDLPPVLGDQIQLEQVLLNLLQNAIEAIADAGPGPRTVSVTTGLDGAGRIVVAVRDTGVGLDEEEAGRVFERFYSTKPAGMGMGLAISLWIVEAHGGRLRGAPNPDRGATFTFTLPSARRA